MLITDYTELTNSDIESDDSIIVVYDENTEGTFGKSIPKYSSSNKRDKFYGFVTFNYSKKRDNRTRFLAHCPIPIGIYLEDVFPMEVELLEKKIRDNTNKQFLIYPLGLGLNKGMIFYYAIRPYLPDILKKYDNVTLLWNNLSYNKLSSCPFIATDKFTGANDLHSLFWESKLGKEVNLNKLNNKHIRIDLPDGVYSRSKDEK